MKWIIKIKVSNTLLFSKYINSQLFIDSYSNRIVEMTGDEISLKCETINASENDARSEIASLISIYLNQTPELINYQPIFRFNKVDINKVEDVVAQNTIGEYFQIFSIVESYKEV